MMFAPSPFTGFQQTPYCQYLPQQGFLPQAPQLPQLSQLLQAAYHTPGKRNLSSSSIPTTTPEEKRQRNNNTVIEGEEGEMSTVTSEVTMADLKLTLDGITIRLASTATKADVTQIEDKVTMQNIEIQQLKTRMTTQDDNIRKLQSSIDECVAANLVLKEENKNRRESDPAQGMSTNMAAPTRKTVNIARRNLIIEGLPGEDEEAIYPNFLRITSAIKVIIYKSNIECLTRLPRRDSENKTPGPVLVTMKRAVLRDNILKNKLTLMEDPDMSGVFINTNETKEVRIAKSILRKTAYKAKQDGIEVEYRHNKVKIAETWYLTEDIDKLPEKYTVNTKAKVRAAGGKDESTKKLEIPPRHANAGYVSVPV